MLCVVLPRQSSPIDASRQRIPGHDAASLLGGAVDNADSSMVSFLDGIHVMADRLCLSICEYQADIFPAALLVLPTNCCCPWAARSA
jgi:hypothetical protein